MNLCPFTVTIYGTETAPISAPKGWVKLTDKSVVVGVGVELYSGWIESTGSLQEALQGIEIPDSTVKVHLETAQTRGVVESYLAKEMVEPSWMGLYLGKDIVESPYHFSPVGLDFEELRGNKFCRVSWKPGIVTFRHTIANTSMLPDWVKYLQVMEYKTR